VLHGDIEHIAMENPGFLPVKIHQQFVDEFKRANAEPGEFTHQLIMVTGDVNDFCIFCDQPGKVPDHHEVRLRKVTLSKLPNVDDVTVQDQCFGFDAAQVLQQLPCMASERPEMNIGYDDKVNFTLW
jgi:hypothetical protein